VLWVIGVVSEGHELAAAVWVVVGVAGGPFAESVAYVLEAAVAPQVEHAGAECVAVALAVAALFAGGSALVAVGALLVAVALA
jgi:hypothetical protein